MTERPGENEREAMDNAYAHASRMPLDRSPITKAWFERGYLSALTAAQEENERLRELLRWWFNGHPDPADYMLRSKTRAALGGDYMPKRLREDWEARRAPMTLNAAELAALRAIATGRVPAEEALRARLKRKRLIARSVFEPRDYYVTEAGRAVLGQK
jgi:hypothetical protein